MKLVAVAIALLLSACAISRDILSTDDLTPSMLNQNVERYDGQQVVVRGVLVLGFEKRYIVDNEEALEDWPSNDVCITAVGVDHLLAREDLNGHLVELRGVFRRNVLSQGVVRLGACNITGLEIDPSFEPGVID